MPTPYRFSILSHSDPMARGFVSFFLFSCFCIALSSIGGVQGSRHAPGTARVSSNTSLSKSIMARGIGKPYFFDSAVCMQFGGAYYGAKATLSVFALPDVESGQTSDSSILVSKGFPDYWGQKDAVNTIRAGWHVSPALYGDTKTRLYTFWTTTDDESTGCYNLRCPGFVLSNLSPVKPGDILAVSTDRNQKYITLTIAQDNTTGDWRLHYADDAHSGIEVGYWPKSLFTSLAKKANIIHFGGEVSYTSNTKGPAMGSGHLGSETDKAASFKDLQYADKRGNFHDHTFQDLQTYTDNDTCYDINMTVGANGKLAFYYGGPPGCLN